MDYSEGVKESLYGMADYVADGINSGAETGYLILGIPGAVVGTVAGALVGGIKGTLRHIF